ncbi:plasmid replication protein RepC [Paracoccus methylarcula]|uniref:plasmid replication protein RepC n=1 Tax=Paracoccus methylarcula TaxID=72022 RepID=UPI001FECCA11|nr:plasmid replication protein RepC [Paracoccus methylarcula]
MTAGLLANRALAEAPAPDLAPDKWAVLRDLTAARADFGISDRDLAVLAALLSFHPGKVLEDDDKLIVFPSNASLSDRAHGMAESTLRRHLSALVHAGLILRRDSPNGKRYATRDLSGALDRAFGFDLRPLLTRAAEITEAAQQARQAELARRRLRETTVILLRDAAKLIQWGREQVPANWDALSDACALLQRALRRKLDADRLRELADQAREMLDRINAMLAPETEETSGSDGENERHYQSSDKDNHESEPCEEKQDERSGHIAKDPPIPLGLVLKATPDILDYAPDGIRSWRDLVATANFVHPMLGISPDAWRQAQEAMGDEVAAVTLACILQRAGVILRPGGYLRALTGKAESAGFSPGPMVMALLRAENRLAA